MNKDKVKKSNQIVFNISTQPTETSEEEKVLKDIKWLVNQKGMNINEKLGTGSFGDVYALVSNNNQRLALKVIYLLRKNGKAGYHTFIEKNKKIETECHISLNLLHPSIIKTFSYFANFKLPSDHKTNDKNFSLKNIRTYPENARHMYFIVMEKATNRSLSRLLHFLNKQNGFQINYLENKENQYNDDFKWINYFSEAFVQYFLLQALDSLEYIHRLRMVHLDIKPENYLITQEFDCKLCDFSLTIKSSNLTNQISREYNSPGTSSDTFQLIFGTLGYLGPEYYSKQKIKKYYADRVDIFAMGALLYYFLLKTYLIDQKDKDKNIIINEPFINNLNKQINEFKEKKIYHKELLELLQKMLNANLAKRPHIYKILEEDCLYTYKSQIKNICNTTDTSSVKLLIELQKAAFLKKVERKIPFFCFRNTKNKKVNVRLPKIKLNQNLLSIEA